MKIQSTVCSSINPWGPGDNWPILHSDAEFLGEAGENVNLYRCPNCRLNFHTTRPDTAENKLIEVTHGN